jgi:hypothetical protein
MFWLTCSLCLITSLPTPIKLEVDQPKTSIFLSRNCRSSACSSELISAPIHTVLSGTLGSSATLVKSPSASIAFLNSAEISCLDEGCSGWCASSLKKCTFLCPGVKLRLIFLASFWLPNMVITPKVAGTLSQRNAKCRAASKMFSKPQQKMAF